MSFPSFIRELPIKDSGDVVRFLATKFKFGRQAWRAAFGMTPARRFGLAEARPKRRKERSPLDAGGRPRDSGRGASTRFRIAVPS